MVPGDLLGPLGIPAVSLPVAVIEVTFDPVLRLGSFAVRWQALAIVAAVVVALVLADFLAARERALLARERAERASSAKPPLSGGDLLLICLGILAGAVVGGRLAHGLAFYDFYSRDPLALFDPARGSLSLLGAVVGGTLTGGYLAALLDGTHRRWAAVAAIPMLVALGLGKLAQFLGGGGQGAPLDAPWAVAFQGGGPWLSPAAAVPAHPSQLYEALWALAGVLVVTLYGILPARRRRRREEGGRRLEPYALFPFALAWWLDGRLLVGFTWRDERIAGPFNAEQLMALAVLGVMLGASAVRRSVVLRERRRVEGRDWSRAGRPTVPDPVAPSPTPLPPRTTELPGGSGSTVEQSPEPEPSLEPVAPPESEPELPSAEPAVTAQPALTAEPTLPREPEPTVEPVAPPEPEPVADAPAEEAPREPEPVAQAPVEDAPAESRTRRRRRAKKPDAAEAPDESAAPRLAPRRRSRKGAA